MRSGELFAGVGGLGMAVDEVFGSTPAWFAEFDAAPSRVLAYRYPQVPNHGDVTKLSNPEKVQILAGGFPCQDVSLAGRRRGMKDGTRSGLWSEYARIIDETRPDWVVIENVSGLLSADAAVDLEPCPLCVGDNPGHVLRALGAVLGDLAELGFDAEWISVRASDIGAPHKRLRIFILAWPSERTRLDEDAPSNGWAATPDTDGRLIESGGARSDQRRLSRSDGSSARTDQSLSLLPTPRTTDMNGPGSHGDGGADLRTVVAEQLLPTPVAQPSGNSPEEHLRKKPGREVVTDLAIIAENGLIETGGRLHASSEGRPGEVLPGVRDTARQEAIRERSPRGSGSVPAAEPLFQTMRGDEERRPAGHSPLASEPGSVEGSVRAVPSNDRPAHPSSRPGRNEQRAGEPSGALQVMSPETPLAGRPDISSRAGSGVAWGPYRAAIERWERVLGRPAPAPVLSRREERKAATESGSLRMDDGLAGWLGD